VIKCEYEDTGRLTEARVRLQPRQYEVLGTSFGPRTKDRLA
jgi:hypothetical protein